MIGYFVFKKCPVMIHISNFQTRTFCCKLLFGTIFIMLELFLQVINFDRLIIVTKMSKLP